MKIGFIAGSGLDEGLEKILDNPEEHKSEGGAFGVTLEYITGSYGSIDVILLPRHGLGKDKPGRSPGELVKQNGYEGIVWFLYEQGVDAIYALSAVGVLDTDIPLANKNVFVVPDDYTRGFGADVHTFGQKASVIHTNMGEPFSRELRERAIKAIKKIGGNAIDKGLYIFNLGDSFETNAEIKVLDRLTKGIPNRLVGMSVVPEVTLAKQVYVPYAAICANVNYAQGISNETEVSHPQTQRVMKDTIPFVLKITEEILKGYL